MKKLQGVGGVEGVLPPLNLVSKANRKKHKRKMEKRK